MKFPSIESVAAALRHANSDIDRRDVEREQKADPDYSGVDVRLQVYDSGEFAIRVCDSSYDQDHRGYWGAGTLDGKRFDSRGMARELLEQCKEQHATARFEESQLRKTMRAEGIRF